MRSKKSEYIFHLPVGDGMEIVYNCRFDSVSIVKNYIDKDVAACVAELRKDYGGEAVPLFLSDTNYYEPMSKEYPTIVDQIRDIVNAINICREKLKK